MQEMWVRSLGGEGSLQEGMATHCSTLAWTSPMDRGAWWARVHKGQKESDTTEAMHIIIISLVGLGVDWRV